MPKTLAPNASPEMLRKQAKQFLKDCRAGDLSALDLLQRYHSKFGPDKTDPKTASLKEAQHAFARQFGCATWNDLLQSLDDPISTTRILVFTNGASAVQALNNAGLAGRKEEWLEVLHEGSLPQTDDLDAFCRARAKVFQAMGWTTERAALKRLRQRNRWLEKPDEFDALELWFEHDLYDQLQLLQLLAELDRRPGWRGKAWLAQSKQFLSESSPESLRSIAQRKVPIKNAHLEIAVRVWAALRSPDPTDLAPLLNTSFEELPHLQAAIRRFCQEFPDTRSGLSRTETQILHSLEASTTLSPGELFRASQSMEEAKFMGDASFFALVKRLSQGEPAPISVAPAAPFLLPHECDSKTFAQQRIQITDCGRAILSGQADWLACARSPRRLGGLCFDGPGSWRWNRETGFRKR